VDGRVALGYARSRHTSGLGDIARAEHQRQVVSAVGAKAASVWTVLNPVRSKKLFALIKEDRTQDVTRNLCRASGLAGG
jgi:anionic cell wall polymer biosynthesis LytR-Cps2A-Psr (LCP) family protein